MRSGGVVSVNTLQWGRGLLTAEMRERFAMARISQLLQWGRGLLTAEIRPAVVPLAVAERFNGAAVF